MSDTTSTAHQVGDLAVVTIPGTDERYTAVLRELRDGGKAGKFLDVEMAKMRPNALGGYVLSLDSDLVEWL